MEAFKLYSSMGFPLDLLTLMAEEKVMRFLLLHMRQSVGVLRLLKLFETRIDG